MVLVLKLREYISAVCLFSAYAIKMQGCPVLNFLDGRAPSCVVRLPLPPHATGSPASSRPVVVDYAD